MFSFRRRKYAAWGAIAPARPLAQSLPAAEDGSANASRRRGLRPPPHCRICAPHPPCRDGEPVAEGDGGSGRRRPPSNPHHRRSSPPSPALARFRRRRRRRVKRRGKLRSDERSFLWATNNFPLDEQSRANIFGTGRVAKFRSRATTNEFPPNPKSPIPPILSAARSGIRRDQLIDDRKDAEK